MSALTKKEHYTKEEYLEMEAAAEYKSEYYDGEIFAKPGISHWHSSICVNLCCIVGKATDDKDFIPFESSMKLEIAEPNAYVYPDLMVTHGDAEPSEKTDHAITNPVLIIEVLSPDTESFDRGKKFGYYQTINTLKEYVLVSQNEPVVEVFFRQDENTWQYSVAKGLESTVTLKSIEYEIALKDIYKKILFLQEQIQQ